MTTLAARPAFRLSWQMAVPYAAFYLACLAIPFCGVSWTEATSGGTIWLG